MIHVRLYGKPDCHLCDRALAHLEALADEFELTIEKVDITQDPALFARFQNVIPVVEAGPITLYAPIHPRRLRRALEKAQQWVEKQGG